MLSVPGMGMGALLTHGRATDSDFMQAIILPAARS